jgi:ComEC/Rec2-related protein
MSIGDFAFGIAAAFLAGVLAAGLGWPMAWFAGVIFTGGFVLLFAKGWIRFWKFALFFFAVVIFGAFYYHLYLHWEAGQNTLPVGKSIPFSAIVSDEPRLSDKFLYFPAAVQMPFAGEVMVFTAISSHIRYGDLLQISGAVNAGKNPGEGPVAFPKTVVLIAEHRGFWLREKMLDFKAAVLQKFREFLSPDAAALLGGITLGGTSDGGGSASGGDGMSQSLKNQMALSGTSYVTSMYGYKIFVIARAIEGSLKHRLARRKRFLLVTASIVLFVAMAGAAVVVIRAAIMAFLVVLAKEVGRPLSKRNALAVIAAGMVFFNPTIIIQFGFTLSFLSVAGIVYLMVPLKKFLRWEKAGCGVLHWRDSVLMAVAVLLTIVPVIVADSGQEFSLAIFFSNALIGMSILFAISFGYALALSGFISRYLGIVIAKFAGIILLYDFAVIKVFAAFTVPLPLHFNSVASFVIYYAALGWFAYGYS